MAKGAVPTLTLSWKNSPEDLELREWVYTHSDKSGFIKDCLRKAMLEEKEKQKKLEMIYKL